ncbi:MAG: hypothetical protein AAFX56_01425 [Pseudomonadota bacterium]
MSRIPRMAESRRNRFFEADGVDELLSMVLELTTEIATLRERQYVTERVLERHGIAVGDEVEAYAMTDADDTRLEAERERMLSTVLRTLGVTPKSIDENDLEEGAGGSPSRDRAA